MAQELNPIQWIKTMAKNSPWLMIAIGLHVILAAVMSIVYIHHEMQKANDGVTHIDVGTKREIQEVVQPPEELDRKKIPENEVQAELVTFEEETTFVPTDEVVEDLYQDLGDPTGADDGSEAFTGGTSVGVGAGGHYGTGAPSAFVSRRAGTATRTKKGRPPKGATVGTEEAVLEGLRWLIRHQNADGSWGVETVTSHCSPPNKPCIAVKDGQELSPNYNTGLTGLALLTFLGQGISVGSKIEIVDTAMGKRHQAGEVVKKGVKWLVDQQSKEQGYFSNPDFSAAMYNEALATMALCEAYGISRNRELKRPAQKAVDWLCAAQKLSPDGARWGWRYFSKKFLDDTLAKGTIDQLAYNELAAEVDISVTTWVVMALKSALLVGLDVPSDVLPGAVAYGEYVTGKEGLVGYRNPYQAGEPITGPGDNYAYHTATMSALGMLVRTFVRHDLDDPFLELASKQIVKDLPTVSKDKLSIDYYYWYYATLALNQFDGPDSPRKGSGRYWEPWNKDLVSAILGLQDSSKGRDACARGGWLDNDRWGSHTGYALYSTAINVLTLEVYYRYENAFGVEPAKGTEPAAVQKPK
ncbi:MAG: hypothetical protein EXS08_04375 [Planctomycetes bacterium]|nr:hypothetical protein [Planctomycetota bacterium]